jgi:hypothetical protein
MFMIAISEWCYMLKKAGEQHLRSRLPTSASVRMENREEVLSVVELIAKRAPKKMSRTTLL